MRTLAVLLAAVSMSVFAQEGEAPAAKTAADFVSDFEANWKTRDSAESSKALDGLIADATKAFPSDYEILWRAGRAKWFVADGITDGNKKSTVAKVAWDFSKKAVAAKSDGWEGKYYVAISIGAYSQAVGVLRALTEGLENQFNENLDAAIKNNEAFDRFGGHVAKGRYYWELPWPKRDLKKSKEELNKTIAKHPEHLRAHYFLASTLLKDGDAKGAKEENDKALNGDSAYDPPEARRVKNWAKTQGEEIDKALK